MSDRRSRGSQDIGRYLVHHQLEHADLRLDARINCPSRSPTNPSCCANRHRCPDTACSQCLM